MIRTRVGYAGGSEPNPTYRDMGDHSETLQVDYDPRQVSYGALLEKFWEGHEPTDQSWSRQYMAAVFYRDDGQRRAAEASKARLEAKLGRKISTAILPLGTFTLAEDYHQKYYLRHDRTLLREFQAMFPVDGAFVNSTAAARANGYLGGYGTRTEREVDLPRMGLSAQAQERLQRR